MHTFRAQREQAHLAGALSPTLLHTLVALVRTTLEHELNRRSSAQALTVEQAAPRITTGWTVAVAAPLGAAIGLETHNWTMTATIDLAAGLEALPPAVELAARVIISEAVANVARHSWAGSCVVRLRLVRGLHLEVLDDGIGLPPLYRMQNGLHTIAAQAEHIGGEWQIAREIGAGTRLTAWLPLP